MTGLVMARFAFRNNFRFEFILDILAFNLREPQSHLVGARVLTNFEVSNSQKRHHKRLIQSCSVSKFILSKIFDGHAFYC